MSAPWQAVHEAGEGRDGSMPGSAERSSRRLFLVTAAYPYGGGEQFLETELSYLVRTFSQVVLLPLSCSGTARAVPPNVVVETSLSRDHPASWRDAVQTIWTIGRSRYFYEELAERKIILSSPAAAKRLLSAYNNASRVRSWLIAAWASGELRAGDIVYTYWLGWSTLGAVMAKHEIPGLSVVSRVHGIDLYEERHQPPYLPFRPAILGGVESVHAVSENGLQYLRDRWSSWAGRTFVSRLGVRDPGIDCSGSTDGVLRIVSCSFLVAIKRIDLLVEALEVLSRRLPDGPIHWTHIGDGPLMSELVARAQSRLPDSVTVRFMGGLPNSEVMAFYRRNSVDVFVNVSAYEGIPVSIMEAESYGIPIVATEVGGMAEIVNDSNGLLLSANPSPEQIATALELFTRNTPHIEEKRIASKAMWRLYYDADRNYMDFCRQLASSGVVESAV